MSFKNPYLDEQLEKHIANNKKQVEDIEFNKDKIFQAFIDKGKIEETEAKVLKEQLFQADKKLIELEAKTLSLKEQYETAETYQQLFELPNSYVDLLKMIITKIGHDLIQTDDIEFLRKEIDKIVSKIIVNPKIYSMLKDMCFIKKDDSTNNRGIRMLKLLSLQMQNKNKVMRLRSPS